MTSEYLIAVDPDDPESLYITSPSEDEDVVREVRAFARTLIVGHMVMGVPPALPHATHGLMDMGGKKVIVRVRF